MARYYSLATAATLDRAASLDRGQGNPHDDKPDLAGIWDVDHNVPCGPAGRPEAILTP